jgi:hypothetical protein
MLRARAWITTAGQSENGERTMPPVPEAPRRKVGPFGRAQPGDPNAIRLLGAALVAVGLILAYLLYEIWPAVVHATAAIPRRQRITLFDGRIVFRPQAESVLILLVTLAGALGAYVHAATSFAKYVGTRRFARSWYWWYLVRLPIGSGLALILYFALLGGLLNGDATSKVVNPYGVAALAALAGLFSKQAVDKLAEVFDTFFRTRPEDGDPDALETPVPDLAEVAPASFSSAQAQDLILRGRGFDEASTVLIKAAESDAPTSLRSDKVSCTETEMVVGISVNELPAGEYEVRVINAPPGGGVSAPVALTIEL